MTAAAPPGTAPARAGGTPGTALSRCDPTVVLAVVVAVPLALVRTYEPAPLLALWALALVSVRWWAGVRWSRLLLAMLPFASFGLSLVMVNAVTRGGEVVAAVGPLEITDLGLRMGAALAVRTMLVGTCAVGLLAAVGPERLLASLHQVAHLPVRTTAAFLAAYRLLDDLPHEWTTIRRAHAVRVGATRLSRSPRDLGRAAFVLLVTSIRRSERIAVSLESRGLGALGRAERTVWRPAGVGRADAVLVAGAAAALGGTLYAAWAVARATAT